MRSLFFIVLLFSGCAVGPKFKSPVVNVPDLYSNMADSSQTDDLREWWRLFNCPLLDSLEDVAIEKNKNLASAIKNIEIARLNVSNIRAAALPSLALKGSAGAKYDYSTKIVQSYSVMPSISWDIDLWGKLRRQIEAIEAGFKATEHQTAAVLQALTAEVATTFFAAQSYQEALNIAQNTYTLRLRSNQLMDSMYYYGAISAVDLALSQTSLATAGVAIEQYQRALDQAVLALNILLGENPRSINLGKLKFQKIVIPVGLPSALLERRPDVMQAYFGVRKANASVGVAAANRLPSISLTGEGGLVATIVKDVTTAHPIAWSGAGALIAPILSWGALRRAEEIARLQTEQAVLVYEQVVLTAINEIELSLVAIETNDKEVVYCSQMVNASKQAAMLTKELYHSGNSSYLDLLDADRTLLDAQLQYVQIVNDQISNYIILFKALGGGW